MPRTFSGEERQMALAKRRENKALKEKRDRELEKRQKELEDSVSFLKSYMTRLGESDDLMEDEAEDGRTGDDRMEVKVESEPKRKHKPKRQVIRYYSDSETEEEIVYVPKPKAKPKPKPKQRAVEFSEDNEIVEDPILIPQSTRSKQQRQQEPEEVEVPDYRWINEW